MRTKDQVILMQLQELKRTMRRFATHILREHKDVHPAFVEGFELNFRAFVEEIEDAIRRIPDGE